MKSIMSILLLSAFATYAQACSDSDSMIDTINNKRVEVITESILVKTPVHLQNEADHLEVSSYASFRTKKNGPQKKALHKLVNVDELVISAGEKFEVLKTGFDIKNKSFLILKFKESSKKFSQIDIILPDVVEELYSVTVGDVKALADHKISFECSDEK